MSDWLFQRQGASGGTNRGSYCPASLDYIAFLRLGVLPQHSGNYSCPCKVCIDKVTATIEAKRRIVCWTCF